MSLVELPSTDGTTIAVNPHHVTAVQPYNGRLPGREGMQSMCAVWVARDQGTNLYVCTWSLEQTLDVLNTAKRDDFAAFEAGYMAAAVGDWNGVDTPTREDVRIEFAEWQGVVR